MFQSLRTWWRSVTSTPEPTTLQATVIAPASPNRQSVGKVMDVTPPKQIPVKTVTKPATPVSKPKAAQNPPVKATAAKKAPTKKVAPKATKSVSTTPTRKTAPKSKTVVAKTPAKRAVK